MNGEQTSPQRDNASQRYGVYVPLLLTLAGIVTWLVFLSTQLIIERGALSQLHEEQASTLQTMRKMRKQLDGLTAGVARLAQQGNPNARLVLEDLRSKGVTIKPHTPRVSADQ